MTAGGERGTHPIDSARGLVEFSDTNTWQANLWSAGCLVIKPKYLQREKREDGPLTWWTDVSDSTELWWILTVVTHESWTFHLTQGGNSEGVREPLAAPCGASWQQKARLLFFSFLFFESFEVVRRPWPRSLTCCFWDGSRKTRRSSAGRSDCTRYSEEDTKVDVLDLCFLILLINQFCFFV